jgi:hypothetical protein
MKKVMHERAIRSLGAQDIFLSLSSFAMNVGSKEATGQAPGQSLLFREDKK